MGFLGAYFGVLVCLHYWLAIAAGQQRYSRCVDYYKTGSTIDGHYDLEILPRIVLSVYCKDMQTGEPSEYISLTGDNYASYYRLLGSPSACPPTLPQRNWDEWGKTHFTRIRFDFDSWLVTTNDFSYATSVEGGSYVPYGQGGDNQTTQTCPFRGYFNINLTSTSFEVDPQVTWSWEGPTSNNQSVSFSNLRQSVSGWCGGLPVICFPVLPSNRSIARLKLRLVSTHPCLTENPCENLGKCLVRDAKAYDCLCLPGSRGSNCEEFLDDNRFNFCAQEKGLVCQNSGTCENIIKTVITTYGGDGSQETCQSPSTWLGKPVTQCVSDCSVGPPFACSVHTNGENGFVGMGWWTPGIVYTLEGWFRPTARDKTIMGKFHSCSKMGVAVDNGKFTLVVVPVTGCSKSYRTRTKAYMNQWHHVAMTVDGTNARLYVNGSLLTTARTRRFVLSPPQEFRLGRDRCCPNKGFVGDIKSFTVWKRVLEKKEIFDHYNDPVKDINATHGVIYNRLLVHYDFCMTNDAQPDCRGTDWGNRDWYPVDGDVVSGVHCNVRTFVIEANVTVKVAPWSNNSANLGESGTFQLYAHDIIINGILTARGAGYKGGEKPTKFNLFGKQGGSYLSSGKTTSKANRGGGGGGHGKPGGGGGYGTAGEPGVSESLDGVGEGGHMYGFDNLAFLLLGSGGGSGGSYVNASASVLNGGKGGNGGGALVLEARNSIRVTGHVSANGEDGESGGAGGGGGGGGSGGSIQLRGPNLFVNSRRVTAIGGSAGCGTLGCGGKGGSGRIRIFSDTFSWETKPSSIASYRKSANDRALLARESMSISQMNSYNDQSVYRGCSDRYHRLSYRVPITTEESEMMTLDFCRQKCYAKNYEVYGVHSAHRCFCNNIIEGQLEDERDCNLPCPGNKNLTCGGSKSSSIYGPIPRKLAWVTARWTCKPWCPVGFLQNSNQIACFWDFKCNCSAGWHGKLCELPCSKDKYGLNCEKDCKCLRDSSIPQLTIIVSVVSSVLALIIFGAIVTSIHRKRHRSSPFALDSIELRNDWEISRGDVFMLEKIGQGAFGVVLKAHLYYKSLPRSSLHDPDRKNKRVVACKMVKGPCQKDSDFMDEIKLMKRIGQHPHIVRMLGCITRSQPLCLIVEYCCHGDLLSNLQKGRLEFVKSQQYSDRSCPKRNKTSESEDLTFRKQLSSSCGSKLDEDQEMSEHAFKDEENVEGMFTASDLLSFAWQISSGMEYLAGKGLVHRDLACRNVLVCENNLLKVSDFGLTRAVYHDGVYLQKKAKLLPLRWMSIEAITHRIFTEKSDVWSFGVVVWEICTLGGFPYSCMTGKKFLSYLRGGNRLACPKSCSRELYTLMTKCWRSDPQQRPWFSVLSQELGKILESEQPTTYIDLDISNADWDLDSITEMTDSSESSEKFAASVDCKESKTAGKKQSFDGFFITRETAL